MGRESATPQLLDALRACAETAVELAQHSPSGTQHQPFNLIGTIGRKRNVKYALNFTLSLCNSVGSSKKPSDSGANLFNLLPEVITNMDPTKFNKHLTSRQLKRPF